LIFSLDLAFQSEIDGIRQSTLRLPGLKAVACSGLTLSGASLPRLQRRGLAPPNGSKNVINFIPIKFCFFGKPLDINSLDELIVLGIEIAHISTIKKS